MKPLNVHGATALEPEDLHDLIPDHLTTQQELNEWEMDNILTAEQWLFSRKRKHVLTLSFLKKLHKAMFGNTWTWAGTFRTRATNLGCDWNQISTQLAILLGDTRYQFEHQTYDLQERCVRFHHRLVSIHPFLNGNGRHARLMADALLWQAQGKRFSWGANSFPQEGLHRANELRKQYLQALRQADQNQYKPLVKFAGS